MSPVSSLSVQNCQWYSIAYCSQSQHSDSALPTNQSPTNEWTALFTKVKLSNDSHVALWIKDWDSGSSSIFGSPCTRGQFQFTYPNGFFSYMIKKSFPLSTLNDPSCSWVLLSFNYYLFENWVLLSQMRLAKKKRNKWLSRKPPAYGEEKART